VTYLPIIRVRITGDVKQKMDRIEEDWPEFIRQAIVRRIEEHEKTQAASPIDEIRARTARGSFDAAQSIREDRDDR